MVVFKYGPCACLLRQLNVRWETEDLREHEKGRYFKKLDSTISRISRYWVSAVHWRNEHTFITYLYIDGRRPGRRRYYISDKDFTHSITIILASASAFGIGFGEILTEIVRR